MQKKIASLSLALLMAFSMALSASAATPRYNSTISANPSLSFRGATANCEFEILADSGSKISVNMTLYRVVGSGVTQVKSWPSKSGTTTLSYRDTHTVTRGEYLLALDISVDGTNGNDSIYKTVRATY